MAQKKIYLVINAFFLSTFFTIAQDYEFRKSIINESMDTKMMLKSSDLLPFKPSIDLPAKVEIDPVKMTIMKATYNHRLDSLRRLLMLVEPYAESKISPDLMKPFTNEHLPFDANYNNTKIFVDGKWVPASSLFGVNVLGVLMLILPQDDPVIPKSSKKQKALKRIKSIYGAED